MAKSFPLEQGWRLVLKDLGIEPADVLRRAELPDDLFSRSGVSLSTEEYFRLWNAVEAEANDPLFPLHIGQSIPVEAFQPPIFAALCSPNMLVAAQRISQYKRLCAPMAMHVEEDGDEVRISLEWLDKDVDPPVSMTATELVFFTQLARTATREHVKPVRAETMRPPEHAADYEEFIGTPIRKSKVHAITFSRSDAHLPFMTANEVMWEAFEPALRKRLSELDESATVSDRVRAALLEALPSGASSMDDVSRKLALSKRTLQRRLKHEGTTYQLVLNRTREELARHYLRKTELSGAEISYLLGYEDPNSFFRAYHDWTGETTEQARLH